MSTQTMYPSATAEDGYCSRAGANEAWAALISNNGTVASDGDVGFSMKLLANATTDQWTEVRRGIFMFDVSPLPPGSIVSGASVSFYPNTITSDVFSSSFCLAAGASASATAIAASDYQLNESPTEISDTRHTIASLVAGTRFSYDLNAAGSTALQTAFDGTGIFKTALLFDWDLDAVSPTWAGGAPEDNVTIMCVENGAPKRPTLTVTFRVGRGYATIQLTGTLANGGDTVTADMWAVEVFT